MSDTRKPSYGTSRFQGSGQEGPALIRTLDGHIQPFKIERELDYDEQDGQYVDLTNVYHCDDEY